MWRVRKDPLPAMLSLQRELVAGTYRPDQPHVFEIAKGDGSRRRITLYCVRDRVVQRALLDAVQPIGERLFLDCSYGFRPGLSVDMACARVREWVRAGYHWLVDADIRRCFDHIPVARTLRLLFAITHDTCFIEIVDRWIAAARRRDESATLGLPQGMCLSPFLCNLYLHAFDLGMRTAQIPLVRYADDFVLLAPSQKAAQRALGLAADRLACLSLALHDDKTCVIKATRRHRFLGKRLPQASAFLPV